jgi:hypothetical protein
MDHLDKGTSLFGPLSDDTRIRLFRVVDHPTEGTWDSSYSIIITNAPRITTLWQALLKYTAYQVRSVPEGPWPEVPTREQILTALKEELS